MNQILQWIPCFLMVGFMGLVLAAICSDGETLPPPTEEDDEYYGYDDEDDY